MAAYDDASEEEEKIIQMWGFTTWLNTRRLIELEWRNEKKYNEVNDLKNK